MTDPFLADESVGLARVVELAEKRYFSRLTFPEVRRALQALSDLYVHRRDRLARTGALDTEGKRSAFGFFYGSLHYALIEQLVEALGGAAREVESIVELGCGTGTPGAAWALACQPRAKVVAYDIDEWAVREARWWFGTLGVSGSVQRLDVSRFDVARTVGTTATASAMGRRALLLAYVLNEVEPRVRDHLLLCAREWVAKGGVLLVVEPLAKGVAPWWDDWTAAFAGPTARADEWHFPVRLPDRLRLMDKAAGLDHRELGARSLFVRP